jgi:hypothetical protein
MSDPFLARPKWALSDEKENVVAVFFDEQLATEAAESLTNTKGVKYQAARYEERLPVRIDDQQFRFLSKDNLGRSIYCADTFPPCRMVVICWNDLKLPDLQDRIVEAVYIRTSLNKDDVFTCPEYADKDFSRLTIYDIAESGIEENRLSYYLRIAPRDH